MKKSLLRQFSLKTFIVIAVLFFAFFRMEIFFEPLGFDQSIFAYMGQRVAAGDLLYKQVSDNKPPVIIAVNALMVSAAHYLNIDPVLAVRIFDTLFAGFIVIIFAFIAKRLTNNWQMLVLLFIGFTNVHKLSQGGVLTEHYLLGFSVLALWFLLKDKPRYSDHFFAGLFFSFAALSKQVAVASVFAVILFLVWEYFLNKRRSLAPLAAVCFLLAGFFIPQAAVYLYFSHLGIWPYYAQDAFAYLVRYQGSKDLLVLLINIRDTIIDHLLSVAVVWAGLLIAIVQKHWLKDKRYRLLLLLLFFETVSFSVSRRFFGHYYLQIAASLILFLGCIRYEKISELLKKVLVFLFCLMILIQGVFLSRTVLRWKSAGFGAYPYIQAGRFIRSNSSEHATLVAYGETVPVAVYAERKIFYKRPYSAYLFDPQELQELKDIYFSSSPAWLIYDQERESIGEIYQIATQINRDVNSRFKKVKVFGTIAVYKRV